MTDKTDSGLGEVPGAKPGKITLKGWIAGSPVQVADVDEMLAADGRWKHVLFVDEHMPELADCKYCDVNDEHPAIALVCWRTETEETEPEPFREEDVRVCADAIIPAMTNAEKQPGFHDVWVEMPAPKENEND